MSSNVVTCPSCTASVAVEAHHVSGKCAVCTAPLVFKVLPAGWEARTDPASGDIYYVDHNTATTHWTHPAVQASRAVQVVAAADPAAGTLPAPLEPERVVKKAKKKKKSKKKKEKKVKTKKNKSRSADAVGVGAPLAISTSDDDSEEAMAPVTSITFVLNGVTVTVDPVDPTQSLNEYLRRQSIATDAKKMCYEGGCGACVCLLSYTDTASGEVVHKAINSCLRPLVMVDGCTVTTSLGIGNQREGFHPIQQRLADNNGSQCGMCSPGNVMNMYELLLNNPSPTTQEVEDHFDGNLCRCTGYRPILTAFKTFASDYDPDDEAAKVKALAVATEISRKTGVSPSDAAAAAAMSSCGSGGGCGGACGAPSTSAPPAAVPTCTGSCSTCKVTPCHKNTGVIDVEDVPLPVVINDDTVFDAEAEKASIVVADRRRADAPRGYSITKQVAADTSIQFFNPTTMADLFSVITSVPASDIRFIVGNTSEGIYKNPPQPTRVYLGNVPQLTAVSMTSSTMTVGAAVTLNTLMSLLEANVDQSPATFPYLLLHMSVVANNPVRNVGCWAGNFMLTYANPDFQSDMFTIFDGVGATLTLASSATATEVVSMTDFLTTSMDGKVIVSMTIPFSIENQIYRSYKVMARHVNSHAIVNGAFSAVVDPDTHLVAATPTIVYGGVAAQAIQATQTAAYLVGKSVMEESTLQGALVELGKELTPDSAQGQVAYRKNLISTLFYKWYLNLLPAGTVAADLQSVIEPFVRPVSQGFQTYQVDPAEFPVSEAIPKLTARIQASGDAIYIDDMPNPINGYFGEFATATIGAGTLVSIDASAALAAPGVVAFITAKDIPGMNSFMPGEVIFVEDEVQYYGQALGLVVADSQEHADFAALLVTATYSDEQTPVLNIEDAIAANSFYPDTLPHIVQGDVESAFASADHVETGTCNLPSQYHFYMETQTAYAIPQENNAMLVHSSTQFPQGIQQCVADTLSLPQSKVQVQVNRVGGAYGGKIFRAHQIAAATSVAAYTMRCPVRTQMDINTNMVMVGKRTAYQCQYKVGFNDDGTVVAIQAKYFLDCGAADQDGGAVFVFFDNVYNIANWDVSGAACKTNRPVSTPMRAPGGLQGTFYAELMMEHVASVLGMDPVEVKMKNLYQKGDMTPYGQPLNFCAIGDLMDQVMTSSDFTARAAAVDTYNKANRWTKQGISVVPIKYGIGYGGASYGLDVRVNAVDGTVYVDHSGIEMGQGLDTKVAQTVAYALKIPLSMVVMGGTSTATIPNTDPTGGSIGSGRACKGALIACGILNDRLAPIRQLAGTTTWLDTVQAAAGAGLSLIANGWDYSPVLPDGAPFNYNSYGCAVTQVQIDVLTGAIEILRMDVLFDCGQSLNPAVDIGQVEGGIVTALGFWLTENITYDPETAALNETGTWTYKPPSQKDIPIDWRVSLLKNSPNPVGVLSSKASAEPPLMMAQSVYHATRQAIAAARADAGVTGWFELDGPLTVDTIQTACMVVPTELTF